MAAFDLKVFVIICAVSLVNSSPGDCDDHEKPWLCAKWEFTNIRDGYQWFCCAGAKKKCTAYPDAGEDSWKLGPGNVVTRTKSGQVWNAQNCPSKKLCKFTFTETKSRKQKEDYYELYNQCGNNNWGATESFFGIVKETKHLKHKHKKDKRWVDVDAKDKQNKNKLEEDKKKELQTINQHQSAMSHTVLDESVKKKNKGQGAKLLKIKSAWDEAYQGYDNIFDGTNTESLYRSSYTSYSPSYYPMYLISAIQMLIITVFLAFIAGIVAGYLFGEYCIKKH